VDRVHREVLDALPPTQRDAFLAGLTTLVNGYLSEPADSARPVRRPRRPS
jgi:MarR family transcriptional regulator, transcriptional regulator for hemolysin